MAKRKTPMLQALFDRIDRVTEERDDLKRRVRLARRAVSVVWWNDAGARDIGARLAVLLDLRRPLPKRGRR